MIIESRETPGTNATEAEPDALDCQNSEAPGDLQREFDRLAVEWKEQGEYLSSPTAIADLPAYRAIIAMGKPALPLILRDLQKEPDLWFMALVRIAEESPVPESARGNIAKMTEAWLAWGRAHGIVE